MKPVPFGVHSTIFTNQDAEVHAGTTIPFLAQLMEADDLRLPRTLCESWRKRAANNRSRDRRGGE